MSPSAKQKHLLVMRLSAMGDVAMTVPVIEALRQSYPDLKITVLTREAFQAFFRNVERVDFFVPDLDGRHKGIFGLFRLFRDLLSLGITHVADLHDVLRTKVVRRLMWLSWRKVASLNKGRTEKRELTRKYRKVLRPLKPMTERYREVLLRLGLRFNLPATIEHCPVKLSPGITDVSGKKTSSAKTTDKSVWVGVAPFAKHKGKIYPTELSAKLIDMLADTYGKVFIFGGGKYEKEFGECMEQRHSNIVSVIGKLKLAQELDLISNLDVMVTMDSATMHMASLVGTSVVSVWGATHPYAGFYGFGQDPDNAVQLNLPCRPCSVYGNKPCMFGDYRCLGNIQPSEIFDRVNKVVSSHR